MGHVPSGSTWLRVSKTKQTRSHARSYQFARTRRRRGTSAPREFHSWPRRGRSFELSTHINILLLEMFVTAARRAILSAQHCPRKLKGVPQGFRFGAANHSHRSPIHSQKSAGFLPLSNAQTGRLSTTFYSPRCSICSSFLNYLFAELIRHRSVSLGFICASGLNPPLSSRRDARERDVNHVLRERTFNPARKLEKFQRREGWEGEGERELKNSA